MYPNPSHLELMGRIHRQHLMNAAHSERSLGVGDHWSPRPLPMVAASIGRALVTFGTALQSLDAGSIEVAEAA